MNKRSAKRTRVPPAPASRSSPSKNPSTGRKGDDDEEVVEKNIWMDPDAQSVDCGICFMPYESEVFMVSTVSCNTNTEKH